MFGDDQYENFKEDVVPPFAVLAYDGHEIEPWKNRAWNPWGEPNDARFSYTGHRAAGKYLASGLLEAGIDAAYAYRPLHHPLGHAFAYTLLLLDDERRGFDYPVVPFSVNCYGRRVNAARGLRLPLTMRDKIRELDPPSPSPARCMAVGAATARVMAKSPWRTAIMASSSWSHSFLTEKHYQLWPDVAADRRLYEALEKGDYATWHRLHDRRDRGQRSARGAELVLPIGRDGGTRAQTRPRQLHRDLGLRLPGRLRRLLALAGRRFLEEAAKTGDPVAGFQHPKHRPERGLVGGDDGLAEFALPLGDRGHRREVAAGDDKDLDLGPVDPSEGVACILRTELAYRVGVGGAEAFERNGLETVLCREIAAGALVDLAPSTEKRWRCAARRARAPPGRPPAPR